MEDNMTMRSIVIISALAIFSAGPAAAEHLTDQDGRQIVDGIEKVKAKAFETKDAAIWGSLFADNAVQLPLSGETSVGRPAIENWFGGHDEELGGGSE
jgi:hypothetical protein